MNIILLNGPAGVGKDTLAMQIITRDPDAYFASFKWVLYETVSKVFNIDPNWIIAQCLDRKLKEQPNSTLEGRSPRQALIYASEEIIKKNHGETGVAWHLVNKILDVEGFGRKTFVIPDSGFNYEVDYLLQSLKPYGLKKITKVVIDREGCTYEGDSREYLKDPDIHLFNNGTIEELWADFEKQYNV